MKNLRQITSIDEIINRPYRTIYNIIGDGVKLKKAKDPALDPTQEWVELIFDGPNDGRTPINTNLTLFDSTHTQWTLFAHVKVNNPQTYTNTALHCLNEADSTYPGIAIQDYLDGVTGMEIQLYGKTVQVDGSLGEITDNPLRSSELWCCFKRNGDKLTVSIDGENWSECTLVTHNSPMVIGGWYSPDSTVTNGAAGREMNGIATVKYWNKLIDDEDLLDYYDDQFSDDIYTPNNMFSILGTDGFASAEPYSVSTCMLVNPSITNGYVLGYNNGIVTNLNDMNKYVNIVKDIDNNIDNPTYQFGFKKFCSSRTYETLTDQFVMETTASTTSKSDGPSGYVCTQFPFKARTTTTYTMKLKCKTPTPQPVYFLTYKNRSGNVQILADGVIINQDRNENNNAYKTIGNYYQYMLTKETTFTLYSVATGQIIDSDCYFSICYPKEVQVQVCNGHDDEFGIMTNDGKFIQNDGTFGTDAKEFVIEPVTSMSSSSNISYGLKAENNPCFVRLKNEDGQFLYNNGVRLIASTNTDENSIWLLYAKTPHSSTKWYENGKLANEKYINIALTADYKNVSTTSCHIGGSIETIGEGAFQGCTVLESVIIPVSVTTIGSNAFDNCTSLEKIDFNGTVEQWNAIEKAANWNNGVPSTCVINCSNGTINI